MNKLPLNNKLNNLSNIRDYFDGSNDINHYYIDVERIEFIEKQKDIILVYIDNKEVISIDKFYKNDQGFYFSIKSSNEKKYIIELLAVTNDLSQKNFSTHSYEDFLGDDLSQEVESKQSETDIVDQKFVKTLDIQAVNVSNKSALFNSIDITAPIIEYEYQINQVTINSNEAVEIKILDDEGNIVAFANVEADESIILQLKFIKNSTYIQIVATDSSGNETVHLQNVDDIAPPYLIDHYVDNYGQLVLIFNENMAE